MPTRNDPPGTKTFTLSGDIAGLTAVKFCQDLEKMVDSVQSRVVVDLRDVSYMDSCGLGGLVYLRHLLGKRGKQVVLLGASERVRDLFKQCNIDGIFDTIDSVDELAAVDAKAAEIPEPE
jgi:anti-sigma B factor antagonist